MLISINLFKFLPYQPVYYYLIIGDVDLQLVLHNLGSWKLALLLHTRQLHKDGHLDKHTI